MCLSNFPSTFDISDIGIPMPILVSWTSHIVLVASIIKMQLASETTTIDNPIYVGL